MAISNSDLLEILREMERNRRQSNVISLKRAKDLIRDLTNSRYKLIAIKDVAGESVVFKCHDVFDLNNHVAIKVALSAYQRKSIKSLEDPKNKNIFHKLMGAKATYNINTAKERFTRGATLQRNLSRLVSSMKIEYLEIPEVLELHETPLYMVMPWVSSQNMVLCLKDYNSLEFSLKKYISLLDSVYFLHQRGVVHRDLKMANILPTKKGIALLDFTTAKKIGDKSLTGLGYSKTTVSHASPKALDGGMVNYNVADDIASLGFVLVEFLTFQQLKAPEYAQDDSVLSRMSVDELRENYLLYRKHLSESIFEPFKPLFLKMTEWEESERYDFVPDVKKELLGIMKEHNLFGEDYLVLTDSERKDRKIELFYSSICSACSEPCKNGFCIENLRLNLKQLKHLIKEELL